MFFLSRIESDYLYLSDFQSTKIKEISIANQMLQKADRIGVTQATNTRP